MSNDSTSKTLIVATLLCVICSIVVSSTAVQLKPMQVRNKKLDIKKNLLVTAGLVDDSAEEKQIVEAFKAVETKVVDLETGAYADIDPESYDARKAAKDPKLNYKIPADKDLANIKSRAKYGKVYLIKDGETVKNFVFPVHGKGLWSTMYGFLVLENDLNTVKGLGFYEHGETPGLGGEVDNPNWKANWNGKKVFNDAMKPVIKVVKGIAEEDAKYKIDGLSGATITSNGVTGLVRYWLSENAFGSFIKKYKAGSI